MRKILFALTTIFVIFFLMEPMTQVPIAKAICNILVSANLIGVEQT